MLQPVSGAGPCGRGQGDARSGAPRHRSTHGAWVSSRCVWVAGSTQHRHSLGHDI